MGHEHRTRCDHLKCGRVSDPTDYDSHAPRDWFVLHAPSGRGVIPGPPSVELLMCSSECVRAVLDDLEATIERVQNRAERRMVPTGGPGLYPVR